MRRLPIFLFVAAFIGLFAFNGLVQAQAVETFCYEFNFDASSYSSSLAVTTGSYETDLETDESFYTTTLEDGLYKLKLGYNPWGGIGTYNRVYKVTLNVVYPADGVGQAPAAYVQAYGLESQWSVFDNNIYNVQFGSLTYLEQTQVTGIGSGYEGTLIAEVANPYAWQNGVSIELTNHIPGTKLISARFEGLYSSPFGSSNCEYTSPAPSATPSPSPAPPASPTASPTAINTEYTYTFDANAYTCHTDPATGVSFYLTISRGFDNGTSIASDAMVIDYNLTTNKNIWWTYGSIYLDVSNKSWIADRTWSIDVYADKTATRRGEYKYPRVWSGATNEAGSDGWLVINQRGSEEVLMDTYMMHMVADDDEDGNVEINSITIKYRLNDAWPDAGVSTCFEPTPQPSRTPTATPTHTPTAVGVGTATATSIGDNGDFTIIIANGMTSCWGTSGFCATVYLETGTSTSSYIESVRVGSLGRGKARIEFSHSLILDDGFLNFIIGSSVGNSERAGIRAFYLNGVLTEYLEFDYPSIWQNNGGIDSDEAAFNTLTYEFIHDDTGGANEWAQWTFLTLEDFTILQVAPTLTPSATLTTTATVTAYPTLTATPSTDTLCKFTNSSFASGTTGWTTAGVAMPGAVQLTTTQSLAQAVTLTAGTWRLEVYGEVNGGSGADTASFSYTASLGSLSGSLGSYTVTEFQAASNQRIFSNTFTTTAGSSTVTMTATLGGGITSINVTAVCLFLSSATTGGDSSGSGGIISFQCGQALTPPALSILAIGEWIIFLAKALLQWLTCTLYTLINNFFNLVGAMWTFIRSLGIFLFDILRFFLVFLTRDLINWIKGMWINFIAFLLGLMFMVFPFVRTLGRMLNVFVLMLGRLFQWLFIMFAAIYAIVTAWNNPATAANMGLHDCVNRPLESDICAFYYIAQYTIFGGTMGGIIIPLLTAILYTISVLYIIDFVVTFIKDIREGTK